MVAPATAKEMTLQAIVTLAVTLFLAGLVDSTCYKNPAALTRGYSLSSSAPSSLHSKISYQRHLSYELTTRNVRKCRQRTCLYGLDLFGLGAPEIVICGLAVAVLYGPDRIKGQLKDNGVKGQIVAEGWREEHNERVADVKKYAVQSRKKRAWKKINLAIENEDPVTLAKLALIDSKSPEGVASLPKSFEEDDLYDDDDDEEVVL